MVFGQEAISWNNSIDIIFSGNLYDLVAEGGALAIGVGGVNPAFAWIARSRCPLSLHIEVY